MGEIKEQKYLNPITVEAEIFVNNLENLSATYNQIDTFLVHSLEKVMNAIEKFLDKSNDEILETENTKLEACDDINFISRIFHCSRCKTDLGKSIEKVALHITKKCIPHAITAAAAAEWATAAAARAGGSKKSGEVKSKRRVEKLQQIQQRINKEVKLSKRTRLMLKTDFNKYVSDRLVIGEKLKCIRDYNTIECDLLALTKPMFPNQSVKIYQFGSRIAGIGTPTSDLDIFIDIGGSFNTFEHRGGKETLDKLHKVSNAICSRQKDWKGLVKVDKARVPILRVIHASTGIECDINLSNSMGSINTKYLEYIFTLQPIARLLCIFMKSWLTLTDLNSDFSTYSMILMVLFYLQNENVLPSMEQLQENVNPTTALYVGPWLCSYGTLTLTDLNLPLEEISQPNLLKFIEGFFRFYKNFNYEENVICPYLGKSVKRIKFDKRMPSRYIKYIESSPDYALELDKKMVVQDPLQLNYNVVRFASAFPTEVFKTLINKSLDVLHETFLFYEN